MSHTNTSTQAAVLLRIEKLLAVQESRGATEAEAATAAAHVQRLLEEHNLSLADVEQRAADGAISQRVKNDTTVLPRVQPWRMELLRGIARNSFCLARDTMFRDAEHRNWRRRKALLVGREVNVRSALLLYAYLTDAILRAVKETGRLSYGEDHRFFCAGAVARLTDRLDDARRAAEAESRERAAAAAPGLDGSHTQLVLSDVYGNEEDLNNDALNGFVPGTTATRRRAAAERARAVEAEHERLVAAGVDDTTAWYRAMGYPPDRAASLAADRHRARNRRGGHGARSQNWSRADTTAAKMVTSAAYREGRAVGDAIGLDPQVDARTAKRIGRS